MHAYHKGFLRYNPSTTYDLYHLPLHGHSPKDKVNSAKVNAYSCLLVIMSLSINYNKYNIIIILFNNYNNIITVIIAAFPKYIPLNI